MARGRKGTAGYTVIDEFVLAYLDIPAEDRPAAMAAIRGADLAIKRKSYPPATPLLPGDEKGLEEVGAAIAAEHMADQ